ncbi:hypothetical protein KC19_8G036200 [Ceratodon purpureus]|uniref:Secreted protein n=1 Tax=Ceratodon purpureus TaxID=3225 RepID=A0A8T0H0C7_CERPU|nr:hypothetical protein KC19_8G036200 [Ceratodon purpureus]
MLVVTVVTILVQIWLSFNSTVVTSNVRTLIMKLCWHEAEILHLLVDNCRYFTNPRYFRLRQ